MEIHTKDCSQFCVREMSFREERGNRDKESQEVELTLKQVFHSDSTRQSHCPGQTGEEKEEYRSEALREHTRVSLSFPKKYYPVMQRPEPIGSFSSLYRAV